jgi:ABC-type branched-subunit amino acid transport system permease subunit
LLAAIGVAALLGAGLQRHHPARHRSDAADGDARASALILLELANKLDWLTGGADGLQGVVHGPAAGPFRVRPVPARRPPGTRCACAVLLFVLARRLVHSPFGATLHGGARQPAARHGQAIRN